MKFIFLIFLITFSNLLHALSHPNSATWNCIDVPTCNLLTKALPNNHVEQLFVPQGDPHQFSPSTGQIKALLTCQQLVLPPRELAPWAEGLKQKRENKTTIELNVTSPGLWKGLGSTHDLAHYWLYPQLHCQIWENLTSQISGAPTPCPFLQQVSAIDELKNKVGKISKAKRPHIIVTHEGVGPLLNFLGLEYLSLKAGHHGANASPTTLKKLAEFETQQKNDKDLKLLIIEEPEITVQGAIAQKLQKMDGERLKWKHLGQLGADPIQPLQNLLDFLQTQL